MELTELHRQILVHCAEDYVGLWSIIWTVNGGGFSERTGLAEGVREETIKIIQDLLELGLIQAGFPSDRGQAFQPWSLSAAETIERINREWDTLGRTPNIGDIVWFTTTDVVDRKAQEIQKQESES